jgi:hypothetical protein
MDALTLHLHDHGDLVRFARALITVIMIWIPARCVRSDPTRLSSPLGITGT